MKESAMPVGPIHHRRDCYSAKPGFAGFLSYRLHHEGRLL
jgi:hypothetical protein